MITDVDKKLIESLDKGEEYWTFKEDSERDYVHALFAYPAMMVPKMQREILTVFKNNCCDEKKLTIFDPFMGSGTVLVEGMLQGHDIIGIDINPLAYLVTKVKTTIYSTKRLKRSIDLLLAHIKTIDNPDSITKFYNIDKWFKPEVSQELDIIKQEIQKEPSKKIRRFMWVIFSDTVRIVSNARSCTYKLHIKSKRSIENFDKSAKSIFAELLSSAYESIVHFQNELEKRGYLIQSSRGKRYCGLIDIRLGDSIKIAKSICRRYSPDLVITSPPYGDNGTTVAYGQYSVLALRWINLQDIKKDVDLTITESQSKIDTLSMGGTIDKRLCTQRKTQLTHKSQTLSAHINKIEGSDPSKVWKVISFYDDFDRFAQKFMCLKSGTYIVMTVGNRTVAKQRIQMDKVVSELFLNYGFNKVYEFTRKIIGKRMSVINSRDKASGDSLESMNSEYIVILKKG